MASILSFLAFVSGPSQDMASTECVVVLEAVLLFQVPESARLCFSPCTPVSGRHGPPDVALRALLAVLALWLGGGCGGGFGGGNFHLPVFGLLHAHLPCWRPWCRTWRLADCFSLPLSPPFSPATPCTTRLLAWLQCTLPLLVSPHPAVPQSRADVHAGHSTGHPKASQPGEPD